MSAHSPGPWQLQEWTVRDSDGAIEGGGLQVVDANGHTITAGTYEGSTDTEEADARLIAAAPDMLQALRRAVLALAFAAESSAAMRDDYNAVSAAIAKATGAAHPTE